MQQKTADIIVVGAGISGLSFALLCEKAGMKVALVERKIEKVTPIPSPKISAWVSALNRTSEKLLEKVGVFQALIDHKLAASYSAMELTASAHTSTLHFHANDVAAKNLGHIVDNHYLKALLWDKVHQAQTISIEEVSPIRWSDKEKCLHTDCDYTIQAPILVGCDGQNSWVREQLGIKVDKDTIQDHAIVAIAKHLVAHDNTARQCFLDQGIIASLPLWDPYTSVIVYSSDQKYIPEDEQQRLKYVTEACKKAFVTTQPEKLTELRVHPIRSMHAQKYYQKSGFLVADAAMSIHPLAGLGLNCGLQAVEVLADMLKKPLLGEKQVLIDQAGRKYEHAIRGYNAFTKSSIQSIHRCLVTSGSPWYSALSKVAFLSAQNLPFIKQQMIYHALYGIQAHTS